MLEDDEDGSIPILPSFRLREGGEKPGSGLGGRGEGFASFKGANAFAEGDGEEGGWREPPFIHIREESDFCLIGVDEDGGR